MSASWLSTRDRWLTVLTVLGAAGLLCFTGTAASADSPFGTQPVSVSHTPALPQTTITSVRIGIHGGYDRIVVATTGQVSDYKVAYVSTVIQSPKGTVVAVPGKAYLTVTVHSVAWTGTLPFPALIAVGGPELLAAVRTEQFEGYVTIALGLQARTGFRVTQSGSLLIVDVKDPTSGAALPSTGAAALPALLAALALLGVGTVLVTAARKRRA
jgi:hypothetical protein